MSRSAILEHLRELNLTGMLAGYKELLDRPGPVTVEQALLELLEAETAQRRLRSYATNSAKPGFLSTRTLIPLPLPPHPSMNSTSAPFMKEASWKPARTSFSSAVRAPARRTWP